MATLGYLLTLMYLGGQESGSTWYLSEQSHCCYFGVVVVVGFGGGVGYISPTTLVVYTTLQPHKRMFDPNASPGALAAAAATR